MHIKNGYYKVENHKEYHKIPTNTNKRNKSVKVEVTHPNPENIHMTLNYNVLNFLTAFVIGTFAPLPITWKTGLIIAVLVGGATVNIVI